MKRLFFKIVICGGLMSSTYCWSAGTLLPKDLGKCVVPVSPEIWLAESAYKVTPAESNLLERAQTTILGNIVRCDAWKPYRGIMPSLGTYQGVWNWDSAFHAVAISHWDAVLAREQFEIIFGKQLPNGALPDVIRENGGRVTNCTKPPVMAWAVAVVDRRSPDTKFLRGIYPKLVKLGKFWFKERGGEADGLFYYAGSDVGYDSGWDNAIRWDNGYRTSKSDDHRLWAVDLNCYMVMHYRAMAYIAECLKLSDDEDVWLKKADALATRINEKLWDDQLGFYVDRDRVTGKNGPALSPAGFMPLFVHIASSERATRVVKLAADPQKFFPGMPTAAYDTPGYDGRDMWRGPAWVNTSYFAIKGIQEYGYTKLAETMRSTLLDWVTRDPSTIWEYYDPKTGDGAGAKGFGWSAAFTITFILDWDNDNLTWFFPVAPKLSGDVPTVSSSIRKVELERGRSVPEN
jgi:glycogen debranching enzyme